MSQGNAHVSLVGQVRVVAALSPQKVACRLMAWCAAGMESVSVASVCVITTGSLDRSVKSVLPAQIPATHTGKKNKKPFSFTFGSSYRPFNPSTRTTPTNTHLGLLCTTPTHPKFLSVNTVHPVSINIYIILLGVLKLYN